MSVKPNDVSARSVEDLVPPVPRTERLDAAVRSRLLEAVITAVEARAPGALRAPRAGIQPRSKACPEPQGHDGDVDQPAPRSPGPV